MIGTNSEIPVEQDTLSHKRRNLPVFVYKDFIRANHIHPKQNSLSVAFLKESGFADMNFSVTSLAMNASYDLVDENGLIDPLHIDTLELNWFEQFSPLINGEAPGDTVFLHTADSLALSQENTNIPETRSQPFEIWLIKLEADRNAPLCLPGQLGTFDPEKLDEILDIQLNLGYVFSSDFCTFSGRRYAWDRCGYGNDGQGLRHFAAPGSISLCNRTRRHQEESPRSAYLVRLEN